MPRAHVPTVKPVSGAILILLVPGTRTCGLRDDLVESPADQGPVSEAVSPWQVVVTLLPDPKWTQGLGPRESPMVWKSLPAKE